jgi:hypothetical protein
MLHNEKLYPLPVAYEKATGVRPHLSTCHRHRIRGINGVRLTTVKLGGRRLCSAEAVRRFLAAVTEATDGPAITPRTNRQREASVSKAERELDRDGITITDVADL